MLKVGLIGAGMVSQHHLIAWSRLTGRAEVVAIADPSETQVARRAEAFGIKGRYATAEDMLAGESLDAIDIAAPREFHVKLVRLGIAANLAVLCQKPFAPDLAEAADLVAETIGKRVMVHENWRFRRYYRDARTWIEAGALGVLQQGGMTLLTSGLLPDATGARPALLRQPFIQGLQRMLVAEVLIHHLDTLRFLVGPLQVAGVRLGRACPDMFGEDNALISLATASGAAIMLLGNLAARGYPPSHTDQMLLLGSAGSIRLEGPILRLDGARSEQKQYDLAECYQASYDDTIAHFVTALENDTPFETSPEENLDTLRLVEDCYKLARWPSV